MSSSLRYASPDYDLLTVIMQKVEVFSDALKRSSRKRNDLYEILWLKSTNSKEWLERRTKYIYGALGSAHVSGTSLRSATETSFESED
jgi:phosphatidylinositol kinase/protein kinase (PI-3  family)